MCLWPQISQPKLSQIAHVGGVLKTSGPADSKYTPGFENWPRFVGVIEQNKISDSFDKYCINAIYRFRDHQRYFLCEKGNSPVVALLNLSRISIMLKASLSGNFYFVCE